MDKHYISNTQVNYKLEGNDNIVPGMSAHCEFNASPKTMYVRSYDLSNDHFA